MSYLKQKLPLWIKEPIYLFLKNYKNMPIKLAFYQSLCSFVNNYNCSVEIKDNVYNKKNTEIYIYLEKKYGNLITKLSKDTTIGTKPIVKTIWVFWWQGELEAPSVVKKCLKSIRENMKEYEVIMIDKDNFNRYVTVPYELLEKLNKGNISITHFSDYYRMALLNNHGGVWIDASLYMKKSPSIDFLEKPLFSIRNPKKDKTNISEWNWTVGAIGGWKGNSLFSISASILYEYWKNHDYCIDYFVFDYIIRLIYDKNEFVKSQINSIETNNANFYYLQDNANKEFDLSEFVEELNSDTYLYKLSWKGNYLNLTETGKITNFNVWINGN